MAGRDLATAVARFGALLRQSGLPVTLPQVTDAVRALEHLDLGDRGEFYLGLRAVFVTRPEELPAFDRCFEAFWRPEPTQEGLPGLIQVPSEDAGGEATLKSSSQKREALALETWGEGEAEDAGEPLSVPAASDAEAGWTCGARSGRT